MSKLNDVDQSNFEELRKLKNKEYIFLTLHRPSNVDSKGNLIEISKALNWIAKEKRIIFPVHPRTLKNLDKYRINLSANIIRLPPLSFKESLFIWKDAILVMTDSGGLQEETTAIGIPCVTLRDNTERPETLEVGANMLAGTNPLEILDKAKLMLKRGSCWENPFGNGHAGKKIVKILGEKFD